MYTTSLESSSQAGIILKDMIKSKIKINLTVDLRAHA